MTGDGSISRNNGGQSPKPGSNRRARRNEIGDTGTTEGKTVTIYQPKEDEEVKVVPQTKEDRMKEYQAAANRLDRTKVSESGLQAVASPSEMFLSEQHSDSDVLAGLAVAVVLDGSRAFVIEIQNYNYTLLRMKKLTKSSLISTKRKHPGENDEDAPHLSVDDLDVDVLEGEPSQETQTQPNESSSKKARCIGQAGSRKPRIPVQEVPDGEFSGLCNTPNHMVACPFDSTTGPCTGSTVHILSIVQCFESKISGPRKPTGGVDEAVESSLDEHRSGVLFPWPTQIRVERALDGP
nr:DNA repair protein RadA/Sms [Ipomoea batatas]